MHLYERHLARARRIVADWDGTGTYTASNKTRRYEGRWERFDSDLAKWFEIERQLRTADEPHWDPKFTDHVQDPLLLGCLMVVEDYWRVRANLPPDLDCVSGSAAARGNSDLVAAMRSFRDYRLPAISGAATGEAVGSVSAPAAPPDGTTQPDALQLEPQGIDQVAGEVVARLKDDLRAMHRMKSAAYGDSWKRRGELLGVLPNVARKIDRLRNQVNWQAGDRESEADTWADLLTYLLKYQTLLADRDATVAASLFGSRSTESGAVPDGVSDGGYSDGVAAFEVILTALTAADVAPSPDALDADLDRLQKLVETSADAQARCEVAGRMAAEAFAGLIAAAAAATGDNRPER
jgi:thymidylate synthase